MMRKEQHASKSRPPAEPAGRTGLRRRDALRREQVASGVAIAKASAGGSMRHDAQFDAGLVVEREAVDQIGAGAVIADDGDGRALLAQAGDDLVERIDAGNVPEMRRRHVDHDQPRRFHGEGAAEAVDRGEEDLPAHPVGHAGRILGPLDREHPLDFPCEEHARQQHAGEHPQRQVVRRDDDRDGHQHDDRGGRRVAPQIGDRIPAERADRHHDHHRDQRRHRHPPDPGAEHGEQEQQERARNEGRQPPATTRGHVDDRLPDHRTAAHAAEQRGDDVRAALARTFLRLVAVGVGHVVDDLRGQQRFQQANGRHGQRRGQDDPERLERQRHLRQREARQPLGQLPHVADRVDRQAHRDADAAQHEDRDQRRRHRAGDARQQVDDGEAECDQRIAVPADPGQLRQLRQEDQDGERVDEAGDDRARHELHHPVEPEQPGGDLDQPHQDGGGEQILDAVVADQRPHQHRDGGGRGGNHARPAAQKRDRHRDRDRGVQADARVDPGNDRKADRFGDQRQRDDDPCEHVAADLDGAAEPLAAVGCKMERHGNSTSGRSAHHSGADHGCGGCCPADRRPE